MIKGFTSNLFRFIVLILAQILIFNNIEFSGYINPYCYILIILLLPFDIPKAMLLLVSFVTGLSIDLFMGTPGVHSSATLLMGFARPYVLSLFSPREGYQSGTRPRMLQFGLEWFVKYSAFLTLLHHFALFYLEAFSLNHFFSTFLRAFLSALFTSLLLIISQFFVFRK